MTDHHTPYNIEEDEIVYLPEEEVKELSRPSSELISKGAFNFPPKQSYLARVKEKTEDMTWEFSTLLSDFCETLSETTNDDNFSDQCRTILAIFPIDPKTCDEIEASKDVNKLTKKIYDHQSFMNFDILIKKLIPRLGSEQDKINAKNYIKSFGDYAKFKLNMEDEVMDTSGIPTWSSLIKALEDTDQKGVASHIRKSKLVL